jgi:tRNA (cytidine/uridine-2'-O-)-methyltransferase
MFSIALYEPEIPPNTGNIIRLCANFGLPLHLIEPLGFSIDEKLLRRAALDYQEYAAVKIHPDLNTAINRITPHRVLGISTKGQTRLDRFEFAQNDLVVFGPETRGIPEPLLFSDRFDEVIKIPMQQGSRSLNLSNAVAIVAFEAWRQLGCPGASAP